MSATAERNTEAEGPEGLIFLPSDDQSEQDTYVLDLRQKRELPEINFTPVTEYPEREFGDHYAKIALGRGYARGLTLAQQQELFNQLQAAMEAYAFASELPVSSTVLAQGAVAVASLVEI